MTQPAFIIVNKIILNQRKELSAKPERIRISDVKSWRNWDKSDKEMIAFKEDVTIVYMESPNNPKATAIKILESLKSFDERMGSVVKLREESLRK